MFNIDIFILTRDREYYLNQSFDSVIKALNNCKNFNYNLVISNNSKNKISLNNFEKYKIINRNNISVNDHVKICIENANSEFLMLFHDDDMLDINFFNILYGMITISPDHSAYAVAAQCINSSGDLLNSYYYFRPSNNSLTSIGPIQVVYQYFMAKAISYPPFSSYVYRLSHVSGLFPDINDAGKFADVTFLYYLSHKKNLLWSNKIGMYYRIHNSNDGSIVAINDYKKLIVFFILKKCNFLIKIKLIFIYIKYLIKGLL